MTAHCQLCDKENAKAICGGCKSVSYCDRQCQIKDWSSHKIQCKKLRENKDDNKSQQTEDVKLEMNNFTFTLPTFDNKLIRIEESKNKDADKDYGYGMIANCNIKQGTIICSEKAMVSLPDYAKQKKLFYIKQQFILLSQTQKDIYKSLALTTKQVINDENNDNSNNNNDGDEDEQKLLDIWVNNHIAIKSRKSAAIFPLLSRVNHSCIGNAHWIWNEKENQQRLIALNDIDKDTEILVNYLCDPMISTQRQTQLKLEWNFQCQCDLCLNDKLCLKMDKIITEYQAMDESLEGLMSKPLEGYKSAQKLVKIVEKHFNSNPYLMDKHCYDAGQFALGLQKWSEASFYLETSFKQKLIAYGQDLEIEQQFMEKVNLLPTKFRSRFRKFDPKYRAKLNKKQIVNNDDTKCNDVGNLKQPVNGNKSDKNGKKKNGQKSPNGKGKNKSNGKTKSNAKGNNRNKQKNKKKKTKR